MNKFLLALITLLFSSSIYSQNNAGCPNANFSMSNFNNWIGYTGSYGNPASAVGIVGGRHTIISAPGIDPNSCGGLQMIPPGSTASARLGNANSGSEGEQLKYTMTVTPQNALFIYKYACVLEDPGHEPAAQPVFQMRLLDASGNQIGGNCGIYTVFAGQAGQNFQNCGGSKWLPWTIVGVNLTAYMGSNVTVEFTTKDCNYGGHYGYAYVVADCMPLVLDLDYCFGSPNINIAGPSGFQSYSWSNGANTQAISVPAATALPTYTVTMQSFSNQGNCTVALTASAIPTTVQNNFTYTSACPWALTQFNSTPTILPTSINGVALANGGAASWFWNFGDGSTLNGNNPAVHQNPTHIYQNPGTYTVTHVVYTQAGCLDTAIQVVNVLPPPVINFSLSNECVFDSVNFVNQTQDPNLAQVTYEWMFNDGSPSVTTINATHDFQTPGTFNVSLAATNIGGCTDTLTQPITIYPLPTINAGNDTIICPGFSIPLTATGAVTYTWETGTQNGGLYAPSTPETISVSGIDANGCINEDSLILTLYPGAVVDAGPDTSVCFGTVITLAATGGGTYIWNNGVIDNQAFTPIVGITTNIVSVTNATGCINSDTMQLTVWANPIVNAGASQNICEGASTSVSGSGANTYVWNNNVQNGVSFIPTVNNTYNVVGTNLNGCIGTDSLIINIEPAAIPSFTAPILEGCNPFTVNLTNTSTGTPYTNAQWDMGNGSVFNSMSPVIYTYNQAGCYDVELTLTTALGCVWDTMLPNYFCDRPLPIADFLPNPALLTDLENMSTMLNNSSGASFYVWDFGDGVGTSTEFEPSYFFPNDQTANFLVSLIAITNYGCMDTAMMVVTLNETQLLFVPNTFTPDGNEYNQNWFPVITADFDPYDYQCYIYNRWGELIWENHNHLTGWDGKRLNGKDNEEGIYTWKIILKSPYKDERKVFTGHVTLLR